MAQKSKQVVVVGVLGMLVTASVFALVITYLGYLPTITSVPIQKSDVWLIEAFYRIARNSFFISGASGLVLGLALPVINGGSDAAISLISVYSCYNPFLSADRVRVFRR
jgi:hypothetical protein